MGSGLDVFARSLPGCSSIGQRKPAGLSRDLSKLLDDIEERSFILACELPAIRHCTGKDLLRGQLCCVVESAEGVMVTGDFGCCAVAANEATASARLRAVVLTKRMIVPFLGSNSLALVGAMIVIVLTFVLGGLANDGTDAGTRGPADQAP